MDSVSTGAYDVQSVNWAYPMKNPTHLPPKSPHGYSMFSSSSVFENSGVFSLPQSQPSRGGEHRRSPSAGYIPQGQPTWNLDRFGSPDGVVVLKKCSHRRSSSDSVAFVDNSYHYMNNLENVTEEDEFVLQEPSLPVYRTNNRKGLKANIDSGDHIFPYKLPANPWSYPEKSGRGDHNLISYRPDKEHVSRIRDDEPFQRHQPRHENLVGCNHVGSNLAKSGSPENGRGLGKASKHVTLAIPSPSGDSPLGSRRRAHNWSTTATFENPSTASESNSHSDDSNDDTRTKSYERLRSDLEVGSEEGGDASVQFHDDHTSSEKVDPKQAKRILVNRQSAQRSRVRKLQYISELEMKVIVLESEVASLSPKVGYYDHERALLNAENVQLKQKLAALTQTQLLKEARSESLKTEVHRLRQLYNQQQQQQPQHLRQQRPACPESLELPLQFFSKLDLGPSIFKPTSLNANTSGAKPSKGGSSLYSSQVILSPCGKTIRRPSSYTIPPSCMTPGGKAFDGGMMGSPGASFMVHNS